MASPQKQSSASAARKAFSMEAGTVFLRTREKRTPDSKIVACSTFAFKFFCCRMHIVMR